MAATKQEIKPRRTLQQQADEIISLIDAVLAEIGTLNQGAA